MFKRLLGTMSVGAIVFATGCGVEGKWQLASVSPTAANRDVEYRALRLDKDGSFYAEAKEGEGIRTTSGTYTYQDGILNLKAHDGEVHTYPAKLVDGGRTLKFDGTWEGNKLELRYERDRKEGA